MKIDDLRHRITFQKPVEMPDGYKGHTVNWQDMVTVWASVEPLSIIATREYFDSQQIKADIMHKVKIRYREDVTLKMRIKHRGRVLEIKSIIDLNERRETLEILCKEEK